MDLRNVSYSYRSRKALADVSFTLKIGITGLLGPNGSGKTTLLKLLATQLMAKSGEITFNGENISSMSGRQLLRSNLGYLPQQFSVMGWRTVWQNVAYAAWAKGLDEPDISVAVEKVLQIVGLLDRAKDRARSLSGGMRQRLGIACATVHEPKVILLDEPTVGLDPVQRMAIREMLDLLGQNSMVLVSTHLVEDLSVISNRVMVLGEGSVKFFGSCDELSTFNDPENKITSSALEGGYFKIISGGA